MLVIADKVELYLLIILRHYLIYDFIYDYVNKEISIKDIYTHA
jgi:hypothetical protein